MSQEKRPDLENAIGSRSVRMPGLAERIHALRIQGTHGPFIPERQLRDLLTPHEIRQELQRHGYPPECLEEHSNILAHQGRKTFAILVEIGHVARVADFVSRDLLDGKLDYNEEKLKEHFETELVNMFMRLQWDYLAPIWGVESSSHKMLRSQTILPFTKETLVSEGSSGKIFEVTLSASHQGFVKDADRPVEIIRKEFQTDRVIPAPDEAKFAAEEISQDFQDFARESRIVRLLGKAQNPHIIKILGSYVHKNVYNILLPRADADLEKLLKGKHPNAPRHESGFFEQLCGLAFALDSVHSHRNVEQGLDMLGCHLDLKPNNILIFGRTWTLADFGLSRLVPIAQGSKTMFKNCIGDYVAPECLDDDWSQQKIGRKSDIWSLGCMICEVVTFSKLGPEGVAEFRAKRKTKSRPRVFDSGFHRQGKLKPEVDRWLARLTRIASAPTRAMIALARQMLHDRPENRPDIRTVWIKMMFLTLNSITSHTQQQLTVVCDQLGNSELQSESVRFEIWSKCLGLVSPSGLQLDSEHEQIIDAYPKLLVQIRSMRDRLTDSVSSSPDTKGLSMVEPHELYLEIRKHNDCLWTKIPSTLKKKLYTHWSRQCFPRTTDAVVLVHHWLYPDLFSQYWQFQDQNRGKNLYDFPPARETPSRHAFFALLPFLQQGVMTDEWGRYMAAAPAAFQQDIRLLFPYHNSFVDRFVLRFWNTPFPSPSLVLRLQQNATRQQPTLMTIIESDVPNALVEAMTHGWTPSFVTLTVFVVTAISLIVPLTPFVVTFIASVVTVTHIAVTMKRDDQGFGVFSL